MFSASGIPVGTSGSLFSWAYTLVFGGGGSGEVRMMEAVVFDERGVGSDDAAAAAAAAAEWDDDAAEPAGDLDDDDNDDDVDRDGDGNDDDGEDDRSRDGDAGVHLDGELPRCTAAGRDPAAPEPGASTTPRWCRDSAGAKRRRHGEHGEHGRRHRHRGGQRAKPASAVGGRISRVGRVDRVGRAGRVGRVGLPRPAGPLSGVHYLPTHVAVAIEGDVDVTSCEVIFVAELGLIAGIMWRWRSPAAVIGIAIIFANIMIFMCMLAAVLIAYRWSMDSDGYDGGRSRGHRGPDGRPDGRPDGPRAKSTWTPSSTAAASPRTPVGTQFGSLRSGGAGPSARGQPRRASTPPAGDISDQRVDDIAAVWGHGGAAELDSTTTSSSSSNGKSNTSAHHNEAPSAAAAEWQVAGLRKRRKGGKAAQK
jgi:hypothetical protein